jgi:hypothetical protein
MAGGLAFHWKGRSYNILWTEQSKIKKNHFFLASNVYELSSYMSYCATEKDFFSHENKSLQHQSAYMYSINDTSPQHSDSNYFIAPINNKLISRNSIFQTILAS